MKTISSTALSLFTGLLILTSCNNAPAPTPTPDKETKPAFDRVAVRKEIEDANRTFSDLVVKGDSTGLANLYTSDAKFMSSGAPAFVGTKNIEGAMSGMIKAGVSKIDLKTKDVFGMGDLVAEEGEVTIYVKDKPVGEEKYIVLWKKEDGKWKLFRDIFNSNQPPPPAKK